MCVYACVCVYVHFFIAKSILLSGNCFPLLDFWRVTVLKCNWSQLMWSRICPFNKHIDVISFWLMWSRIYGVSFLRKLIFSLPINWWKLQFNKHIDVNIILVDVIKQFWVKKNYIGLLHHSGIKFYNDNKTITWLKSKNMEKIIGTNKCWFTEL